MLKLNPPAKINWFLHVLDKRGDGYHGIQSLMQCVGLYDEIAFEESGQIEVMTDAPIPADTNLVSKAAHLLRKEAAVKAGAKITLKKNIPIAAGLGGGSSDCSYTLKGLNELWGLKLDDSELIRLAGMLGSDAPFFMGARSAFVEGRGEVITPVNIKRRFSLLLMKPPFGVSSGWAYSGVKEYSGAVDFRQILDFIEQGDFVSLKKVVKNDLEAPVIKKHPEIADLKKRLMENGALFSLMSGSGSTVFGVFENEGRAEAAAETFENYRAFITETIG